MTTDERSPEWLSLLNVAELYAQLNWVTAQKRELQAWSDATRATLKDRQITDDGIRDHDDAFALLAVLQTDLMTLVQAEIERRNGKN